MSDTAFLGLPSLCERKKKRHRLSFRFALSFIYYCLKILIPDQPTLKYLRDEFVLDASLREKLDIPDGILCTIIYGTNVDLLVWNFFFN